MIDLYNIDLPSFLQFSPFLTFKIADPCELLGIEGGTADEASINLGHAHQAIDGFRGDTSTVLDASGLGHLLVVHASELLSDKSVHLVGLISPTYKTGSDGPDGLVSDDNIGHLLLGNTKEILGKLHSANVLGNIEIKFLLGLTNAQNGLHSALKDLLNLLIDVDIVVIHQCTALRVTAEDVFTADGLDHRSSNGTSVGTLVLEIHALGTDGDTDLIDGILHLGNEGEGREEDDLRAALEIFDGTGLLAKELGEVRRQLEGILLGGGVHLPVTGHDGLASGKGGGGSGSSRASGGSEGRCTGGKGGDEGDRELHFSLVVLWHIGLVSTLEHAKPARASDALR